MVTGATVATGAVVAGVHTAGAGMHRPELPPDVSASAAEFEVASTVITPHTTPVSVLIFMVPLQGFARFPWTFVACFQVNGTLCLGLLPLEHAADRKGTPRRGAGAERALTELARYGDPHLVEGAPLVEYCLQRLAI